MDDKSFYGYGDISAELNISYTTVRRNIDVMVKKKLLKPMKKKVSSTGHFYAVLSTSEFKKFKDWMGKKRINESVIGSDSDNGFFYLILLIPEYSNARIKAGFTSRLESRFTEHLISAPTAEMIYSAPCQRAWETFLLAYVHGHGKKIRSEVFDIWDAKKLIKNLQTLFKYIGQRK